MLNDDVLLVGVVDLMSPWRGVEPVSSVIMDIECPRSTAQRRLLTTLLQRLLLVREKTLSE